MKAPQILVIGGGIAGLCAAITARRIGASVRLIEAAPRCRRGGNSRHARNFRFCHDEPGPYTTGRYSAEEFASDIERATSANGEPELTRLLIDQSRSAIDWLQAAGVALQPRGTGRLPPSRRTAFLLGGGQAMVNALYRQAERLGVELQYQGTASKPSLNKGRLTGIALRQDSATATAAPEAVILACSGAQANRPWLEQHCGAQVRGFINRGTPESTGELLIDLLAGGIRPVGDPRRLYLVAVDARSPMDDGGIVTRIRGMPHGMVVDRTGRRFQDEGADSGSTRYALWGQRLAEIPEQIGYLLLDADGLAAAPAAIYPPILADSPGALAERLGIDCTTLLKTMAEYNRSANRTTPAVQVEDSSNQDPLLRPPRTGPARPLQTPPFAAYPMRPGLTFTYHGLAVDRQTRVLDVDDNPIENLFAAGTLMAPNLCPQGYLSGLMLTIGLVFGRLAGEQAARYVRG